MLSCSLHLSLPIEYEETQRITLIPPEVIR